VQLLGWLAGSGHPSPQGSLHLLAAQADSPKTASRQHLRIFRQVNDPAACETSPEGMKVAEHGRLKPQTSLHFSPIIRTGSKSMQQNSTCPAHQRAYMKASQLFTDLLLRLGLCPCLGLLPFPFNLLPSALGLLPFACSSTCLGFPSCLLSFPSRLQALPI